MTSLPTDPEIRNSQPTVSYLPFSGVIPQAGDQYIAFHSSDLDRTFFATKENGGLKAATFDLLGAAKKPELMSAVISLGELTIPISLVYYVPPKTREAAIV